MAEWRRSKAQERFRRYASPGSLLFSVVYGVAYFLAIYYGYATLALVTLGLTIGLAGLCGLIYFVSETYGKSEVPFFVEAYKNKSFYFFVAGIGYTARAFSNVYIPPFDVLVSISYLLTGAVAGGIFIQNLLFLISLRIKVATWKVIPFPQWVFMFLWYLARKLGLTYHGD